MKKKQDELLSSNYDGIQEYDNDLPGWWRALFFLTVIWGCVYAAYYLFGLGATSEARLNEQMTSIEAAKPKQIAPQIDENTLLAFTKDQTHLANGSTVYTARCAVCHGNAGQGIIGPNLTDEYYIHGPKITDALKIVETGVLDKGMLAWKGVITDTEIQDVVAYIFSIRGSNPATPKEPQGQKY